MRTAAWLFTVPIVVSMAFTSALADTPRLLLFDSEAGMTAQALKALQVPCTLAKIGDYADGTVSPFDYQVVISGMDVDRSALGNNPERLLAFVRSGGVFLGMRSGAEDSWLPTAVKMDKAYELGEILQPDHPLFRQPTAFARPELNRVHGGSIYRAFHDLGQGWVPLVSTGREQTWDKTTPASAGPHYGILELTHGKGRIILCQMIPDYGFINDDKGQPGLSSQFLQNLLAYVTALAPSWPAPKPRLVPPNFHADLGDLLRAPTATGTLPMADQAWHVTRQGAYTARPDRRGVMTVSAADQPAVAGSFLQLEREAQVAPGQVFLRFYSSDDYCGGTDPTMVGDARVSTRENRVKDTRFKQVLVNGQVVWEQDVLGLNERPASARFHLVDITSAAGKGGRFRLALRVEDRRPTAENEPFATDVYWAAVDLLPGIVQVPVAQGQTSVRAAFDGPEGRYAVLVRALDEHTGQAKLTAALDGKALGSAQLTADDWGWYWINFGEADLRPGSVVTVEATRDGDEAATMQAVAFVPVGLLARAEPAAPVAQQSPLFKPGPPVTRATFPVLVSGPEAYKPRGEVVTGGMPFAYGALKSEQNLRLLNDQSAEVPLQTRVLATWPDGSLKWVLFSFPTGPGELTCEYGTQVSRGPVQGLTVTQTASAIAINTGPLQVTLSKTNGDLCETLALRGTPLKDAAAAWPLTVTVSGKQYSSLGETVTRCEVVEAGPERALVRRVGRLRSADGGTLLEYDLLQEFTANSDVMRVQPVLTHRESSAEEKLDGATLAIPVPALQGARPVTVWLGDEAGARFSPQQEAGVTQQDDQTSTVKATATGGAPAETAGKRQTGYLRVAGNDVAVDLIPRWFWQMYPKTSHGSSRGVEYGFLGALTLHQGEAVWDDFALRFSNDDAEPLAAAFDAWAYPAVALPEPQYTAATLALGQFLPEDETLFPEYEASVESCYKGAVAKRDARREYGAENFGDDTFEWGYGPVYTFWSNQEYDHHFGMLTQFLRSGDWRWWEAGDAGTRHHVNVDCYHFTAPGQEYRIGSPHHHNAKHFVEKGWVADHTVAASDVSHSWVEGQIAYYFLTGDRRTFENLNAMGEWYVWCVDNNRYGAGGQERGPGWTLIALSALYNATHDPKYYAAGEKIMDWLRGIQDPVRGVVSIPISEQPSYEGGSSFMHGIVARGAGRWYEASGDERGKLAALGIADWLTSEAMGPPARFYYKQAPRIKGNYGSDSQCLTALTYGLVYGDETWYGPLAETLYAAAGAGERSMAWVPQSLAHLRSRFTPYRALLSAAEVVAAPDQPATVKLTLICTAAQPVPVQVKVAAAPPGTTVQVTPATLTLDPGSRQELTVTVAVREVTTASGAITLQLVGGQAPRECVIAVKAVPQIVRIELSAAEASLRAPFALTGDNPPAAAALRDAAFTGNPRQPGELAGWAEWTVDLPVAGSYTLTADCWWLDDKGNSLFLQVDGGPEQVFGNDGTMQRWHPVPAASPLVLTAGRHSIRLVNREDGGKVRRLMLEGYGQ